MALQASTQFRRSGQRDDRRRRLLADELAAGIDARELLDTRPGDPPPRKSEHYGDAAFMDEQLRLTDLIPRRLTTVALILLVGMTLVVGLEVLYAWMPDLAPMTSDGRVAAFDLDSEGSLGAWFSALTLVAASLAALLVYVVRRYRTDDYQGRYRIWLWAAACWFLMATDEASSLHEGFKEMMAHASGTRLVGDGSIWWAAAYVLLLGVVGSRLLLDMLECRLSSFALVMAAGCWVLAVATQFGWVMGDGGARAVMLEEGAEMAGNLLLLAAMCLHGRHVVLDAEGRPARRRGKSAKTSKISAARRSAKASARENAGDATSQSPATLATKSPAGSKSPAVDQPHKTPQGPVPRPDNGSQTSTPTANSAESREDDGEPPDARSLSKADRKALRKRLEQQRLQRQQQQRAKW